MMFSRKSSILFVGLCSFPATALAQQPSIQSAINAASFAPSTQANGKLARGSIFTIFGAALGPREGVVAGAFPVPLELGGTAVEIASGGASYRCGLLYVSATQINAIVPSDTPAGSAIVAVRTAGGQATQTLQIADRSVGIFTLSGAGSGTAVLTNPLVTNPAASVNSVAASAQAGEIWDIWATGLGPISTGDLQPPPLSDMSGAGVEVLVGGRPAEILFRGRSPCCAGVDQIRFRIPTGVSGCCTSLVVRVGGVESNRASIAIGANNSACSGDLSEAELRLFRAAGSQWRYGAIGISRVVGFRENDSVGQSAASATGTFGQYDLQAPYRYACVSPSAASGSSGIYEVKNIGSCTVRRYRYSGTPQPAPTPTLTPSPRISIGSSYRFLDAGASLSVTGASSEGVDLPLVATPGVSGGFYTVSEQFTGQEPATGTRAERLLASGRRTISGTGGADLGRFSEEIEVLPRLEWTNVGQINSISSSTPVRLTWAGGASDAALVVIGSSFQFQLNGTSVSIDQSSFQCLANSGTGAFTVPAEVVAELPPGDQPGSLSIQMIRGREIQIPSLDYGYIWYGDASSKVVRILQP